MDKFGPSFEASVRARFEKEVWELAGKYTLACSTGAPTDSTRSQHLQKYQALGPGTPLTSLEKLDFLICFRHGRPAPPVTLETASVSIIIQQTDDISYTENYRIIEHRIAFVYEGRVIVKFVTKKEQFRRPHDPTGEAEAAHLEFLDEVFEDLSENVGEIIDGMLKEDIKAPE